MAIHKKEAFGKKKQQLALFGRAIAHPARVAILKILAREEQCNCANLVDRLPLSQSTVSQHLKELKDCGLITGATRGTSSIYALNQTSIRAFEKELKKLLRSLKN